MTYGAQMKVTEINDRDNGTDETSVEIVAESVEGTVHSNTEGKIKSIKVTFSMEDDETALKVGDDVSVSGHFSGAVSSG